MLKNEISKNASERKIFKVLLKKLILKHENWIKTGIFTNSERAKFFYNL